MKWRGRILWLLAGGIMFAAGALVFSLIRDGDNQTITVSVVNSLDHPVHIRIVGDAHPLNLGEVQPGQEIKREITIGDLGEGPARFMVDGPPHDEYLFGDFSNGKGPYERFIRLTPGGPAAFFRSPGKGGWCGILEKESRNIGHLPASLQHPAAATRDSGGGAK